MTILSAPCPNFCDIKFDGRAAFDIHHLALPLLNSLNKCKLVRNAGIYVVSFRYLNVANNAYAKAGVGI